MQLTAMDASTQTTVVKKRGRPRKVVDTEAGVTAEKGARKASTTAKATPAKPAVKKEADKVVTKPKPKTTTKAKGKTEVKTTTSSKTQATQAPKATIKPAIKSAPKQPTPAAPSSSKIIQQVVAKGTFKPPPPTTTKPPQPKPQPLPSKPPSQSLPPQPQPTEAPFPPTSPLSKIKNITTDPITTKYIQSGKIPPKYAPAGRRVTAIIVCLPVVLVTSYELYNRFVLGVEGKKLVRFEQ